MQNIWLKFAIKNGAFKFREETTKLWGKYTLTHGGY